MAHIIELSARGSGKAASNAAPLQNLIPLPRSASQRHTSTTHRSSNSISLRQSSTILAPILGPPPSPRIHSTPEPRPSTPSSTRCTPHPICRPVSSTAVVQASYTARLAAASSSSSSLSQCRSVALQASSLSRPRRSYRPDPPPLFAAHVLNEGRPERGSFPLDHDGEWVFPWL